MLGAHQHTRAWTAGGVAPFERPKCKVPLRAAPAALPVTSGLRAGGRGLFESVLPLLSHVACAFQKKPAPCTPPSPTKGSSTRWITHGRPPTRSRGRPRCAPPASTASRSRAPSAACAAASCSPRSGSRVSRRLPPRKADDARLVPQPCTAWQLSAVPAVAKGTPAACRAASRPAASLRQDPLPARSRPRPPTRHTPPHPNPPQLPTAPGEKLSESNASDVRTLCSTLLNAYLIQLLDTGFLHAGGWRRRQRRPATSSGPPRFVVSPPNRPAHQGCAPPTQHASLLTRPAS
jgi:hypothetical protein